MNDKMAVLMELHNVVDKYAAYLKKENVVVDHLLLRNTGKFPKTIFYFLHADQYVTCEAIIAGKSINLGNRDGMQVPCNIRITG